MENESVSEEGAEDCRFRRCPLQAAALFLVRSNTTTDIG
ncbi:hypothetical protein SLEP1_g37253 [Rubroshorea leprosula]|uniref:Uncharacterized protein n=1 Tax=Rubroshorea leprosula TaxID=152421 RepID=A0AAV5KUF7_9ROSI|nr:hypothetical protein SLEP1_g37253 [Rubroshorea leprosula]